MERVSTAFDRGIELTARGVAKLSVVLIRQEGKVFYCVVGNRDQVAGNCLVIVVDPFDREVVVVRALATHGRSRANSQGTRLADSGTQQ